MKAVVLTPDYLEKQIGVSIKTIQLYLCRSEFSHVKRVSRKRIERYYNITNYDIERLKELIRRRNVKRGVKNGIS